MMSGRSDLGASGTDRPLLIVTALDEERRPFEARADGLAPRAMRTGAADALLLGSIDGLPVALLRCGVGKLAAATATAIAMELSPRGVISVGSAGALHPGFAIGDVVIADEVLQHDFGVVHAAGFDLFGYGTALPSGGEPRIRSIGDLARSALDAARGIGSTLVDPSGRGRDVRLSIGTIATGDAFVNDRASRDAIRDRTNADLVEMEGAAIAYVATRHLLPWLIVRSVSDAGDGDANVSFDRYLLAASENAAAVVTAILPTFGGPHV